MEDLNEENKVEVNLREKRCMGCSRKIRTNQRKHVGLKMCENFLHGWFLVGSCCIATSLISMFIALQDIKKDICDWLLAVLISCSAVVMLIGVGLVGMSLSRFISFVISECRATYEIENINSALATEDPGVISLPESSLPSSDSFESQWASLTLSDDVNGFETLDHMKNGGPNHILEESSVKENSYKLRRDKNEITKFSVQETGDEIVSIDEESEQPFLQRKQRKTS